MEGETSEPAVAEEAGPCSEASEAVTYFETWELDPAPYSVVLVLER